VQTKRLAASFETFTGSVEHTGPEKFPRKATCGGVFFRKSPKPSGRQREDQNKETGLQFTHQGANFFGEKS